MQFHIEINSLEQLLVLSAESQNAFSLHFVRLSMFEPPCMSLQTNLCYASLFKTKGVMYKAHIIPAQALEQVVVGFGSKFDATQKTHRRLGVDILRKFDLVEVFRCYPTKYRSEQKHAFDIVNFA